jgi:hypothetical protein
LVAGPGVTPQVGFSRLAAVYLMSEVGQARLPMPTRRMRPRGFLTDLPAQMMRRLSTPSLAADTSAVSRMSGGCLTCRSPHREVPSRFERAPEAALVKHPCWRKAAVSIRSGVPPNRFPSDADRPIG